MSGVELLCEIMAQPGKACAAKYKVGTDFNTLLSGGFVRKTGVVQSVACHDCNDTHDAEIVHDEGRYGYFCPELGFVTVAREQIEAVTAEIPILVSALADAFNCTRRKGSAVQGSTWRIGGIDSDSGRITLYFHPDLRGEQGVADLRAALSNEVKTPFRLILTAQGALRFSDAVTVSLADVVELRNGKDGLWPMADPLDLVNAPRKRVGGAPNRHKATLAPLIHSRIQDGTALPGRNEEAKALLYILQTQTPSADLPSLPTINRYLSQLRAGS